MTGWHTWNVRSVLSHVHMPDGLALNLALKEYRVGGYLKETLIGRFAQPLDRTPVEEVFPGAHAYDESYTEITVRSSAQRSAAFHAEGVSRRVASLRLLAPHRKSLAALE